MTKGKFYKHKNNKDVCIQFLDSVNLGENIKGPFTEASMIRWINITGKRHFLIDIDTIIIQPKDMKNWLPFESNYGT